MPYSFAVVDDDEMLRHLIERALTRAFDEAAMYDATTRTAQHAAPPPTTLASIR